MNITNETPVSLPKELQKAVEAAKNTLTVTEQEAKRLIALAKDQESIVRGLLDKKADIENEVSIVDSKLEAMRSELEELSKSITAKKAELKAVEVGLEEAVHLQDRFQEAKDSLKALIGELV